MWSAVFPPPRPSILSSPVPPSIVSAPLPPLILSLPSPPLSVSSPPRPSSRSSPTPPSSVSVDAVLLRCPFELVVALGARDCRGDGGGCESQRHGGCGDQDDSSDCAH